MPHKLIFMEHAVETLGYFSRELSLYFQEKEYQIFFVDMKNQEKSVRHLVKFIKPGQTALITFNFIGLSGEQTFEEREGYSIWESRNIALHCILVDHPLYYHKQLEHRPKNLTLYCIDRQHIEYLHRYYPDIICHFLPLAGNYLMQEHAIIKQELIPYHERQYDVALIANYVHLPTIEEHFTSQTQEYIDFYHEILNHLRMHPNEALDPCFEQFVLREVPEASDRELLSAYAGMLFLDMYNRTYFRERTVQMLVDHGVKVHVFGKDWEKLKVEHPENLIPSGAQLDSAGCVKVIQNTKIALNTMPWFKDGAHDRIFTAMLNGAVSLTDSSKYLKERFTDGRELCFYELEQLSELPGMVRKMLTESERMEQITRRAYEQAAKADTWYQRAALLETYIL